MSKKINNIAPKNINEDTPNDEEQKENKIEPTEPE